MSKEQAAAATSDGNSAVAIYDTHQNAESAIKELQKAGFDMKRLSIVGKDYHSEENVVGYYNTGDRMMYWGKQGAFWGGLWECFLGRRSFSYRVSDLCLLPGRW